MPFYFLSFIDGRHDEPLSLMLFRAIFTPPMPAASARCYAQRALLRKICCAAYARKRARRAAFIMLSVKHAMQHYASMPLPPHAERATCCRVIRCCYASAMSYDADASARHTLYADAMRYALTRAMPDYERYASAAPTTPQARLRCHRQCRAI